jgi:hypothetical protein
MKRSVIAAGLILLAWPSGARGQGFSEEPKYAGLGLSLPIASFFHKPDQKSVNVGLSAAGFIDIKRWLRLEGELSTWAKEQLLEDYTYKLRTYMTALYINLYNFKSIKLTPYIGTGLFLLQNGSGSSESELIYYYYGYFKWKYAFGAMIGGGLRWQPLDKVGFRLDVRDMMSTKKWGYQTGQHFIRTALSVTIRSPLGGPGRRRAGYSSSSELISR